MDDIDPRCVCGHAADEHLDVDFHRSEACDIEGCDCICYEAGDGEEDSGG